MSAEDSLLQAALERGYLSVEQIAAGRLRQAELAAGGSPQPLLAVLAASALSPAQVAELRRVHASGQAPSAEREADVLDREAGTRTSAEPRGRTSTGRLPERFGPYLVERELARGGMGVVFVARHRELGRQVALKIMLGTEARHRERFAREALATAKLRHPHVVAIHEAGQEGAIPYLVMDLIEGESLAAKLAREGPSDPRAAALLTQKLASALQAAHAVGILHRDLKPGNVLVDLSGQPLLTDFGLAKDLDAASLTKTGQALGTLAYMPPEQATGARDRLGPPSDVYALGATLYELLCGRPPFLGAEAVNVLVAIVNDAPRPLRELRPDLDPWLEAICLRCLEKEPAARYASAAALEEDLGRWLAGEVPQARLRRRRGRWVALALTLAAAGGFALAYTSPKDPEPGAGSGSEVVGPSERPPAARAGAERTRAAGARALERLGFLPPSDRLEGLGAWLERYPEHPQRGEARALQAQTYLETPRQRYPQRESFGAIFLDAQRLVTWSEEAIVLWSLSGEQLRRWQRPAQRVVVGPGGTLYACAYGELLEAQPTDPQGTWSVIYGQQEPITRLVASPSGRRLAFAAGRSVLVWDLAAEGPLGPPLEHLGLVRSLAFASDVGLVVGCGGSLDQEGDDQNLIQLWDLSQPQRPARVREFPLMAIPHDVVFSPTGEAFAAACNGENLVLFSPAGGAGARFSASDFPNARGAAHRGVVRSVAFSPNGRRVASASGDPGGLAERSEVRVWSAPEGRGLWSALEQPAPLRSVAFDSSGALLLVASSRGAELWDLSALAE